jgi:hypothetical protein
MEAQPQPAGASYSTFLMAAYLPALRTVSTWFPWSGGNAGFHSKVSGWRHEMFVYASKVK